MHLKRYMTLLILLLTLMALSLTIVAQDDEEMMRQGNRLDAPTYGVRGPHAVGTMEMVLDNEARPLPMTIWYPALNPDDLEEMYTYPISYPPVFVDLEAYGHALFEAAPDASNAPYPLVIFSHGFTGHRTAMIHAMEHLASWGYVVIAPDHLGMTASEVLNEPDTFYPIAYTNPTDVSLVIDFAEALPANSILDGMIDADNIASTGHSSGGMNALQVAGGQLDLVGLSELCEDGLELNDCVLLVEFMPEIAELYRLESVPEGLYPAIGDERVDVAIPFAPDQLIFGDTGLNNVTIPVLYLVGTQDMAIAYEDFENGFASLGSETAYMIAFDYAGHGIYQDTCETFPAMIQFDLYDMCAEKVWDKLRAHDLINHYTVAFLSWHLKGDEDAAAVFDADTGSFPGITVINK